MIIHDERIDAVIDVIVQRPSDSFHIPEGIHTGKIPLQHEILIVQRGGIFTDLKMSEQPVKFIGQGQIIIIEQGGKQQAQIP